MQITNEWLIKLLSLVPTPTESVLSLSVASGTKRTPETCLLFLLDGVLIITWEQVGLGKQQVPQDCKMQIFNLSLFH